MQFAQFAEIMLPLHFEHCRTERTQSGFSSLCENRFADWSLSNTFQPPNTVQILQNALDAFTLPGTSVPKFLCLLTLRIKKDLQGGMSLSCLLPKEGTHGL